MNTTIYPIADNCEIHFTTDVVDKTISVVEYDTISETKTRLTQWSKGHWQFANPMQHDKFDYLCRNHYKLRTALKDHMAYLRNPYEYDGDLMKTQHFIKLLSQTFNKTLKLFL
jgi:hypothetical protein